MRILCFSVPATPLLVYIGRSGRWSVQTHAPLQHLLGALPAGFHRHLHTTRVRPRRVTAGRAAWEARRDGARRRCTCGLDDPPVDLQCLVRTASGRRMQQSTEMPLRFYPCGSGARARTSELRWFGGLHTRERSPLPAARPAHNSWRRDLAMANAGSWARAGCGCGCVSLCGTRLQI